eukprot:Clim_evm9s249 gene=Clim_evmTU9s249
MAPTYVLPVAPESVTDEETTVHVSSGEPLFAFRRVKLEPCGHWFEHFAEHSIRKRDRHGSSTRSGTGAADDVEVEGAVAGGDEDIFDEEEDVKMYKLDPAEWKKHDLYKIIGLSKLRWRATQDDIKRAHKKKVLRHHPDKLKQGGDPNGPQDDNYFKCITRAFDILTNPIKRRAFDSCDPTFDEEIPDPDMIDEENFFEVLGPIFEANGRFSVDTDVIELGHIDSTAEEVEEFYDFWYSFSSWREFSWLDEEETDQAESREEKRWLDRENKRERQRRKKEDNARLIALVDLARAKDPRLLRIKREKKARKEAEKAAKQEAQRQKEEEAKRKKAEEQKAKDDAEKAKLVAESAAKENKKAKKEALKKQRRALRARMAEVNYFSHGDSEVILENSGLMEVLCESLTVEELTTLNENMAASEEAAREAFIDAVTHRKEGELKMHSVKAPEPVQANGPAMSKEATWTEEEQALLTKAVRLYPAGYTNRWETIANYINDHAGEEGHVKKTEKDVIGRVKDNKGVDVGKIAAANNSAFERLEREKAKKGHTAHAPESEASVSYQMTQLENVQKWETAEQKQLEEALRKYKANEEDRWAKIAKEVPGRSEEECKARFQYIVEMIKKKKEAAAGGA